MHFLQTEQWKKAKELSGNQFVKIDGVYLQLTKAPLGFNIGYLPRVDLNKINVDRLIEEGIKNNCIYIKVDPANSHSEISTLNHFNSIHNYKVVLSEPIHIQNNLVLDLTLSQEQLLAGFKQKHRYNLKVAQKHGVEVSVEHSDKAFETFYSLFEDTVKRQSYHGRSKSYLRNVFDSFGNDAVIFTAYLNSEPLVSWFVIQFNDTLYYVYGGSSDAHRNVMAPYAVAWSIIEYGKQHGYKYLDFFGITPDKGKDPLAEDSYTEGYSRFKIGFGGKIVRYADTVDIVLKPTIYSALKLIGKAK